jgi:hypothetical protein
VDAALEDVKTLLEEELSTVLWPGVLPVDCFPVVPPKLVVAVYEPVAVLSAAAVEAIAAPDVEAIAAPDVEAVAAPDVEAVAWVGSTPLVGVFDVGAVVAVFVLLYTEFVLVLGEADKPDVEDVVVILTSNEIVAGLVDTSSAEVLDVAKVDSALLSLIVEDNDPVELPVSELPALEDELAVKSDEEELGADGVVLGS